MNYYDYQYIDQVLEKFGYKKTKSQSSFTNPNSHDNCRNANSDIPLGFQDLDPMFLTVICEIVSNAISGNMPVNVANSYGNWIQTIAQAIFTFNAQVQYFEGGPGRTFNPMNRNILNPFCSMYNTDFTCYYGSRAKKEHKRCKKNQFEILPDEIKKLKNEINALKDEINALKGEIDLLK